MKSSLNQKQLLFEILSKVRGATFKQIQNVFSFSSSAACRQWLNAQVKAGVLESKPCVVGPLPELAKPLFSWAPSEEGPKDFEALAYQCRQRLEGHASLQTVFSLSDKTAQFLGVSVAKIAPGQATHDLAVTQIYLLHFRHDPSWQIEDCFRENGNKRADAHVKDDSGQAVAIEFIGKYTAGRIAAFHASCSAAGTPYHMY